MCTSIWQLAGHLAVWGVQGVPGVMVDEPTASFEGVRGEWETLWRNTLSSATRCTSWILPATCICFETCICSAVLLLLLCLFFHICNDDNTGFPCGQWSPAVKKWWHPTIGKDSCETCECCKTSRSHQPFAQVAFVSKSFRGSSDVDINQLCRVVPTRWRFAAAAQHVQVMTSFHSSNDWSRSFERKHTVHFSFAGATWCRHPH